ncbi:hypothetical protein U6B65_09110 [Oscillospiraceae bacterium MB08-C2-2]|nr:hypothetical protein U6B65_09110 [Oscillospiraceae bacterium MB08-C2-2]
MEIHKKRRRRYAAPIGGVFILIALIGVITIVVGSIGLTTRMLDNSKEKTMFERLIRPVVMFNPVPFEKATDLDPTSLLQYSMWATLSGEKGSTFVMGENATLTIPASDLDVAASKLLGPEVKLEHKSFGDYLSPYTYDPETASYYVPVTGDLFVYSPVVVDIQRDKEFYNLTVGYIPPDTAWTTDFVGNKNARKPDKFSTYVMRKVKNDYQLVAVRDLPSEENTRLLAEYNPDAR